MGRMKRRGQRKQRGQRGVEGGRFQVGKGKISRRKGIISGGEEEDSRGEGKIFLGTMDHECAIFLESTGYGDVRNDVPRCLTCKYTNTNTQIQ